MNPFSVASAISRLQTKTDGSKSVWVTSATAGELLLGKQAGLRPLGQVMGTSVFSPGGSFSSSAVSGELQFLTGAYRDAQTRAMARLRAEAKQLNADGVVHVQVRLARFGRPADDLFEFSLIGTAVKTPFSNANGREAFLCSVSGAEYWLLWQAGWRAAGLAVGNCAYFAVPRYANLPSQSVSRLSGSFERTEYSDAISQARHRAMARMEADARVAGGSGIVGVSFSLHKFRSEDGMGLGLHFFASGTVVARTAAASPGEKNAPSPVLAL